MAEMQADRPPGCRVDVTGSKTAHLASETIAIEDFSAEFCRDAARKSHQSFCRRLFLEEILTRRELDRIIVGEDGPALLAQFAHAPGPFADVCSRGVAKLNGTDNLSNVREQESPNSLF